MSGVSLPVTRASGRALLVSSPASRAQPLEALGQLGFECTECDEPYAATAELCRRSAAYRAVVLSLASLYQEELLLIRAVKQRFPQIEVWLTHTDGRQAALAEAMRLGADCLLAEDGLHRIAATGSAASGGPSRAADMEDLEAAGRARESGRDPHGLGQAEADAAADAAGEPVLTADELRALLHEQPTVPASGNEESHG